MLPSIGQLNADALRRTSIRLNPTRKRMSQAASVTHEWLVGEDSHLNALPGIVPKSENQQNTADDDVEHHRVPRADDAQVCAVKLPAQQRQVHFATCEIVRKRNAKEHNSQ